MKKFFMIMAWAAVIVLVLYFRSAGLYRGLAEEGIYHPDEPKQIVALWRFLNDEYVWRVGSVFYDGYPYGLNHLDEYLLRLFVPVKNAAINHAAPEIRASGPPDVSELYYLARFLRLLYGVTAVLLACFAGRCLKYHGAALWYMVLVIAVAPVSIAVSHTATGDVGTDLFGALLLLFLCIHVKRDRRLWLFLAGMAVGMAFACKYNGILCGAAAGFYLLMRLLRDRALKEFTLSSLLLLFGCLAGVAALNPSFILAFDQTVDDVWANFVFIQSYGAGEWYEELSTAQKVAHVFKVNIPRIIGSLGWYLTLTALGGVLVSGRMLRKLRKKDERRAVANEELLLFSIFLSPFAALIISLAGKPAVQPFHFSFLLVPMAMAAVYMVSWLVVSFQKPAARIVIAAAMIGIVMEPGLISCRDAFYWVRGDNQFFAHRYPENIFTGDAREDGKKTVVKDVLLECDNAAVFRNRVTTIELSGGEFWNEVRTAPVPSVPYPTDLDWIFMNGPAFPRSDRMFMVNRDTCISRHLVFRGSPEIVEFGVRSGSWPVKVAISAGGVSEDLVMAPDSQRIVSVRPEKWKRINVKQELGPDIYLVELNVRAMVGDVYVSVLASEEERGRFELFGGGAADIELKSLAAYDSKTISEQVERTRYLESGDMQPLYLDSSETDDKEIVIPAQGDHEPNGLPLAAGVYNMECDLLITSDEVELEVHLRDMRGLERVGRVLEHINLKKGHNKLHCRFQKPFSPYQSCIILRSTNGAMRLDSWRLAPDAGVIMSDVKRLKEKGERSAWMRKYPEPPKLPEAGSTRSISFGPSLVELKQFYLPSGLENGKAPNIVCAMELKDFSMKDFGEYFIFMHLVDGQGKQVYATGFSLAEAAAYQGGQPIASRDLVKAAPGEYQVVLGVWNYRTKARLSVAGEGLSSEERKDRKVFLKNAAVK